jgi:DnaJ-class molecular chaperone
MARIHTHYDNLKVARNAPPEVIRAAYKTLSQKYHPDRNPGSPEAIRITQILNSAYEVLSDPVKRSAHDDWIANAEAQERKQQQDSSYSQQTRQTVSPRSVPRSSIHARKRRHHHRPALLKALQKMEIALELFFRTLFRKMRHAPHANNGRRR